VSGAAYAQRKLHDLSANYKCELAGEALKFWRQASKRVV